MRGAAWTTTWRWCWRSLACDRPISEWGDGFQRVAQRPDGLAAVTPVATFWLPSVADWPRSREGTLVLAGEGTARSWSPWRGTTSRQRRTPRRLDFSLRVTWTAPRMARRALGQLRLPLPLAFDAQLLVSELVSNSVRHAGLGRNDRIRVTA